MYSTSIVLSSGLLKGCGANKKILLTVTLKQATCQGVSVTSLVTTLTCSWSPQFWFPAPAAPNQAPLAVLTPHSLLVRSTVHIPDPSQTHCTYLCGSLTSDVPDSPTLRLSTAPVVPCMKAKDCYCKLSHVDHVVSLCITLVASWLSPLSPSINTLVWPLTSVSPSLWCDNVYHEIHTL